MNRKTKDLRTNLLAAMVVAGLGATGSALAAPAFKTVEARPAATQAAPGARLIIEYRDGNQAQATKLHTVNAAAQRSRAGLLAAHRTGAASPKASYMRRLAVGADLVRLSSKVSPRELDALVRELALDPAVKSVQVDTRLQHTGLRAPLGTVAPQLAPNDQYFTNYQWHLHNPVGGANAPAAWDLATGEGVVVAVLDTGIVPHPDMDANMLQGYDFITDTFVSRRPTAERVPGAYDYGDWNDDANECPVDSSSFHGTHVAGTVAELTNNGIGMAGLAHNAKVLPVRVLGRCGGYTADIADAIVWAAGGQVTGMPTNPNPAEVINLSLGGSGSCNPISQTAINKAVGLGATVVVAAGNSNGNVANFSPASCNNVVSVGAGRVTGGKASYSNYGALVDLTGPGGGGGADGNPNGYVWQATNSSQTSPDQGSPSYVGMAGTSMAAPHVAAVAAMIQSAVANPLTPAELEAVLKSSVRPFPVAIPGSTPMGTGLLDAKLAIEAALADDGEPGEGGDAIKLVNKVAVSGISGAAGSGKLYSIEVAAGAKLLTLTTYGGTGNVSLFASREQTPTPAASQYSSSRPGNSETIRVANPAAGVYYVLVSGESNHANVSLQARVD